MLKIFSIPLCSKHPILVTLLAQVPEPKVMRAAPQQPIAYNHKTHAGGLKLECQKCHPIPDDGDFATIPAVKESEELRREKDISMAACMDCHRSRGASITCAFCHEVR